jgi:hypothetical protein
VKTIGRRILVPSIEVTCFGVAVLRALRTLAWARMSISVSLPRNPDPFSVCVRAAGANGMVQGGQAPPGRLAAGFDGRQKILFRAVNVQSAFLL